MAVVEQLKELDKLKREQEEVIKKINIIHMRLQKTHPQDAERFKEDVWLKLKSHYIKAIDLAAAEERVSTQCAENVMALVPAGQALPNRKKPDASEKKRKRIKNDTDSSRLSSPTNRGTTSSHANLVPNDQDKRVHTNVGFSLWKPPCPYIVAARVTSDEAENHEWIVVKLTRYDREANKYEVIDEEPDDDGGSGQRRYKLPPSCIIPFPKKTDVSGAHDFQPGQQVLAVYPGTTALYKAAVAGPYRKKKNDDYQLEFDGDEEEGVDGLPRRKVPFYHVVQLPEGHKQ